MTALWQRWHWQRCDSGVNWQRCDSDVHISATAMCTLVWQRCAHHCESSGNWYSAVTLIYTWLWQRCRLMSSLSHLCKHRCHSGVSCHCWHSTVGCHCSHSSVSCHCCHANVNIAVTFPSPVSNRVIIVFSQFEAHCVYLRLGLIDPALKRGRHFFRGENFLHFSGWFFKIDDHK